MTTTPMDIRTRPFSVEPFTNIMLPDGIFDTALKKQRITCFYTNTSGASLNDVTIYLEGVGDPGIVPVAHSYFFPEIKSKASVRVSWLSDFENGTPGKKNVSIIAQANGMSLVRTIKQIFVSQTVCDAATGEYTCTVEEGSLKVTRLEVISPKEKLPSGSGRDEDLPPQKGPWVPAKMNMAFYPNPSYPGIHGDLPFNDPWWKILAAIVAIVAAIVAIVEAFKGQGTAGTAVGGTFEETTGDINCCTPAPGGIPGDESMTVAGVASAIATGATAVAMSDEADPWWRGQEATVPADGELTVAETVDATFDYPEGAPQAGEPYPVHVTWDYVRITTSNTYRYSVEEMQKNIHVNSGVKVEVPAEHHAFAEPLVIKSWFVNEAGKLFAGEDLYAFSLLRSPDDMYFLVSLEDNGIEHDENPNDGAYTGAIHLEEVYSLLLKNKLKLEGIWSVYVFAQNVNNATPDMLPQIAARTIGGFMVASGLQITFDPSLPCPLEAQAKVKVIS
ncbi:MAG: hypothetical protein GY860_00360 [Desulfobacteraceae bacterium]|nr:hypothetical protein [Desulfobacteraceae bacterium]